MTVCVYALTGVQPLASAPRGLAGERLRLVTGGGIAAIVGELPRAPEAGRDALERFDGVMRRLHENRAALLPARFGSCFTGTDELLFVLRSRGHSLRRAVAQVRGRAQMTVRVVRAAEAAPERSPPAGADRGSGRRDARSAAPAAAGIPHSDAPLRGAGSRYLRARAASDARAREVPGFEVVREAVRRWVRAERVEAHARVASVYHLVPRSSSEAYRAAAERAALGAGLRIMITGPWPAYAFAD